MVLHTEVLHWIGRWGSIAGPGARRCIGGVVLIEDIIGIAICSTSAGGFVHSIIHLRPVLAWSTSLDLFLDDTLESTNAHTSLTMSGQSIVSSEGVTAEAWVWFATSVNLGVTLEIMTPDEALAAVVTTELSITEVSLHVGLDVLFTTEALIAVLRMCRPICCRWGLDHRCTVEIFVKCDVCLFNGCLRCRVQD